MGNHTCDYKWGTAGEVKNIELRKLEHEHNRNTQWVQIMVTSWVETRERGGATTGLKVRLSIMFSVLR